MKLGEFFIQLGVKGNTDKLKETKKQMDDLNESTEKQEEVQDKLHKTQTKSTKEEEKLVKIGKELNKTTKNNNASLTQNFRALRNIALGAIGAVTILDRLVVSMARANQQAITFNRTTGIGLGTLNRYATASAMVNANSSYSAVAGSLSNVASNLWDIQMGRGDISPYQELAFVGGKAINPVGKSVEQVIEEVREAIKGVDDLRATNIIERMGFSPDDLLMLRMTRGEFEKIQSTFLSPEQQERMNKLGIELNLIHLQMQKTGQEVLLHILPAFNKFMHIIEKLGEHVANIIVQFTRIPALLATIGSALGALAITFLATNPALAGFLAGFTALFLLLDDLAVYFAGGNSIIGLAIEGLKKFGEEVKNIHLPDVGKPFRWVGEKWGNLVENVRNSGYTPSMVYGQPYDYTPNIDNKNNTINQNNSVVVNTTQPADKVTANNINDQYGALLPLLQVGI